jgi:hypothetical protein
MMFFLTLLILIAVLSFFIFRWNENKENPEEAVNEISDFKMILNEDIAVEKWTFEKTGVTVPGGIVFLDDHLFVTDKASNTIVILDREGNYMRKNSDDGLNLINPTIIKTDGESLYVIDSGNNQLKILSENLDLINSIDLPVLDKNSKYWDLEIINENIYFSSIKAQRGAGVIYRLGKNGTIHKIAEKFIGYLSNLNDELMAENSLEYYESAGDQGGKSGKNSLFKVSNEQLKKEFDYVSGYIPLDFLFYDNHIYVFSAALASLDKYTTDGHYIETLLKFDDSDMLVQLESFDNSILVSYPSEKVIYKIDIN